MPADPRREAEETGEPPSLRRGSLDPEIRTAVSHYSRDDPPGEEGNTRIRAARHVRGTSRPFFFCFGRPLEKKIRARRGVLSFFCFTGSSTLYLIGLISIATRNRRSEHHGDHATRIKYYRRRLSRCIHSHIHVHTLALTFRSPLLRIKVCPVYH